MPLSHSYSASAAMDFNRYETLTTSLAPQVVGRMATELIDGMGRQRRER
jgi:hypothetical protein